MILYIVEVVDYDNLNDNIKQKLERSDITKYMVIKNKHNVACKAFDRLGSILSRLNYSHYNDYESVDVFKNDKDYEIGDIVGVREPYVNTFPDIYHTYYSDIDFGDIYNKMILRLHKPQKGDI